LEDKEEEGKDNDVIDDEDNHLPWRAALVLMNKPKIVKQQSTNF
jgi:hypothetical protein